MLVGIPSEGAFTEKNFQAPHLLRREDDSYIETFDAKVAAPTD